MPSTHVTFNSRVGARKPENIINRQVACPFCDRGQLTDIIDEDGPILLIMNKYPVLNEAFQTVLVETETCDAELSEYPKAHLYRVMHFGMRHWLRLQSSGDFASVLFFKNHGPFSGGTMRHPHMQIVGLKHVDYHQTLDDSYVHGVPIVSQNGVTMNVSTQPRVGFFEFNVLFSGPDDVETMADFVQAATHYTLNYFHRLCQSYNLFFYTVKDEACETVNDGGREGVGDRKPSYVVKIVPRFVTSPLYIGYSIPQVSDSVEHVARAIQSRYFA